MTPELRKLLELSAKAMGYAPLITKVSGDVLIATTSEQWVRWLPHLDKAQYFDMECALQIDTERVLDEETESEPLVLATRDAKPFNTMCTDYFNNDHAKSRMMAVLRVEAEIGWRMQV